MTIRDSSDRARTEECFFFFFFFLGNSSTRNTRPDVTENTADTNARPRPQTLSTLYAVGYKTSPLYGMLW
ncbi:hypothetical protein I79_025209 [Cricetulus griseus]|uniref:Uncharacterized protein n=1 Tax=Cricetulus griseus TaxID=10029 RepID=G3IMR4_CRIGR|nr:hypothetical protein I79_025209 [Cricetulus griseus]